MPRFSQRGTIKILFNGQDVSAHIADVRLEHRQESISAPGLGDTFARTIPGERQGIYTITAYQAPEVEEALNRQEDGQAMKNISTKEQVEVRTALADIIKEAVETKYGKCRTWVETETVGPLGGVSAKVLGAVEYNGVIVPFAIQVYSDDRIADALNEQLDEDAENDALRNRLGWAE